MTHGPVVRSARDLKDTVQQGIDTINEIYTNLVLTPEQKLNANLKVIDPTDKGREAGYRRSLVHYRYPNDED